VLIGKTGEAGLSGAVQVHVDTWKSTYRGIVPDAFLEAFLNRSPGCWVSRNSPT